MLEDVLAHIAAWEPHIKALYLFDPDGARAVAKASTERWQKGEPRARSTACLSPSRTISPPRASRCRLARPASRSFPQKKDAPPAARLREAGAVIFSKTTMPDYGMLSSGLSSFHPLTRNPWDLSKNPGGSSAGAGAAGAAGYGPLHLGTDIGGSVRLPAAGAAWSALKPSLGRVPIDPPYVGRVAGPMTRTVDDAALMMSVLSKPDRRDGMSLPPHEINWKALEKSPRKLRIGLMLRSEHGKPVRIGVTGARSTRTCRPAYGREHEGNNPLRRCRVHARGARYLGGPVRPAPRGNRHDGRSDHPLVQGRRSCRIRSPCTARSPPRATMRCISG